jgi:hypothetical protein
MSAYNQQDGSYDNHDGAPAVSFPRGTLPGRRRQRTCSLCGCSYVERHAESRTRLCADCRDERDETHEQATLTDLNIRYQ